MYVLTSISVCVVVFTVGYFAWKFAFNLKGKELK